MGHVVWTDDLSVGVPELDDDHQVLIDLLNRVADAGPSFGEVFSRLIDYVATHFEREERFMEGINYPDRDRHKRLHDAFSARIGSMLRDHAEQVFEPVDSQVADFLWDWLRAHIMVEDRKYAVWVARKFTRG